MSHLVTKLCIALVMSTMVLAGCGPTPPDPRGANLDDTRETYTQRVRVADEVDLISVLIGRPGARICSGKAETAAELMSNLQRSVSFKDDYVFLDVTNEVASYRAFFKKQQVISPQNATFIFCSGAGAALSGNGCLLAGISEKGCFETYLSQANSLNDYAKAAEAISQQAHF